uniref:GSTd6 n=1 Tax=Liposcelis entomophila TaxID=550478 RepID=A0A1J0F4S2_9NEOP|nr:GSTd6 [Liposcelis entomophila]
MAITLYYFAPSPPARIALLAARAVGVDVDIKVVDLFNKEHLTPEFIKINPQHTIPTLDDNGFILWESRTIATYLVRQYGKDDTLYPKNPQLKALVDQRLYFDCDTLWPRIRAIGFPLIWLGETKISEKLRKSLNEAIGFLDKFLHGRKWLCGNNYTIADISILASLSSIVAVGWDISDYPNVKAWLESCKEIPGHDENQAGADAWGDLVRKNLEPGQL